MTNINFVHFKFLPMSMRVLFSMVLIVFGTGYLMAMIQVWENHAGKDGKPMLTAKDLMISYSGNPEGTKMEAALRASMADMLPAEKREVLFNWLHAGAPQDQFESTANPIIQEHCVMCHNPDANPHLPNFTSYEGVSKVTAKDEGMTIHTLVRVSHIHLFSITFIFFIVGYIFTHAYVRPTWLKCALIAAPFVVLLTDVASWYLTKVWSGFAWVVIGSGAIMGMSFAAMWFISMWQMWIGKVPTEVSDKGGQVPCVHMDN
ncbi:MAG: hypothetical protein AB1421_01595 [Pseudomonadota bacterium]